MLRLCTFSLTNVLLYCYNFLCNKRLTINKLTMDLHYFCTANSAKSELGKRWTLDLYCFSGVSPYMETVRKLPQLLLLAVMFITSAEGIRNYSSQLTDAVTSLNGLLDYMLVPQSVIGDMIFGIVMARGEFCSCVLLLYISTKKKWNNKRSIDYTESSVPWNGRFVTGHVLWWTVFYFMSIHVRMVTDKVKMGKVFISQYFILPDSALLQKSSALFYSSTTNK